MERSPALRFRNVLAFHSLSCRARSRISLHVSGPSPNNHCASNRNKNTESYPPLLAFHSQRHLSDWQRLYDDRCPLVRAANNWQRDSDRHHWLFYDPAYWPGWLFRWDVDRPPRLQADQRRIRSRERD